MGGRVKGEVEGADYGCLPLGGRLRPESDRSQVTQSLLDLNKSLFSLTASRGSGTVSRECGVWRGAWGLYLLRGEGA